MSSNKGNYEDSLIGLAKNYGNYFEDANTSFGAESWNHIVDPETYELLLLQPKKDSKMIENLGDWHGCTCYEYLEGRDAPCENCRIHKFHRDNLYIHIKRNEQTDKTFFIESLLVDRNGQPAVLEKVIDISKPDYKDFVMNQYIHTKNMTDSVLGILMEESHITENFDRVCHEICDFFDADRALITEYCLGKLNTTWSRIPQPFTQVCTELSTQAIAKLTEATASLNYIWVPDVPNAEKLTPELREYWSSRGIQSILLIPMSYNGSFIGTVSLHNIREHLNSIDALKLLGMAVAKCIHSYVTESQAQTQLYADPLTGAYNLSGLKRRAYELFREYPKNQYYFCVMDIHYFGGINRRYGFELGDRILIKIADTLGILMDKDEIFCRISADTFCFLAKYPGEEEVHRRFAKFTEVMQCFETLKNSGYTIEFQCGAYVLEEGTSIAAAIDKANLARLSLKNEPGGNVVFFNNDMLEKSRHETELLQDFRAALTHGELTVYYQPQCNYSSQKVVGAEALVRWKSPKHGNVSPAEFIPLLEQHGLIHDLDRFVWEEVCKHQQKWMAMGFQFPISVNVSRHDMLRNNICEEFNSLLEKYNIPKHLFPLEITETAYIKNSEELINAVDMLKKTGFIVEMDDFGSGYSSLNALKDVPVDLLKLDMKFLDMGDKAGRGGSILSCVVRMTRWLGLSVLAEGVETREQAEYLKNIGCNLMQGYYFARPMPAEDFENLLLENGADNRAGDGSKDETMSPDKFMESMVANPLLFNNIGAAAIIEYGDETIEALMVNDSFLELLGMTREEFLPHMKDLRKCAETLLADPEALTHYSDSASGTRLREVHLKRKDGSLRTIRFFRRTMLDTEDGRIGIICLDDITELSEH